MSAAIRVGKRVLHVLANDDPYALLLKGGAESESRKLLHCLAAIFNPNGSYVFADVGANIGFTALEMSDSFPSSQIHAFEPAPRVFGVLQQNVANNDRIHVNQCAVSHEEMTVCFVDHSAFGRIVPDASAASGGEGTPVTVAATTLAGYARRMGIEKFHFVKVDVEGFELDVFEGAGDCVDVMFFECNPFCICCHYRRNPIEVLERIAVNWELFRFGRGGRLEQVKCMRDLLHDVIVFRAHDDFVAVRKGCGVVVNSELTMKDMRRADGGGRRTGGSLGERIRKEISGIFRGRNN